MICGATHDLGRYLDSGDEDDRREGMAEDILQAWSYDFNKAEEVAEHHGMDAHVFFSALNGTANNDAWMTFREYFFDTALAEADYRGRRNGYFINDDYSGDDNERY